MEDNNKLSKQTWAKINEAVEGVEQHPGLPS